MSSHDEVPNRFFGPSEDDLTVDRDLGVGAGTVTEDAREVDALLGAEIKPPAKVWRKLQAQLRRDGIIK